MFFVCLFTCLFVYLHILYLCSTWWSAGLTDFLKSCLAECCCACCDNTNERITPSWWRTASLASLSPGAGAGPWSSHPRVWSCRGVGLEVSVHQRSLERVLHHQVEHHQPNHTIVLLETAPLHHFTNTCNSATQCRLMKAVCGHSLSTRPELDVGTIK